MTPRGTAKREARQRIGEDRLQTFVDDDAIGALGSTPASHSNGRRAFESDGGSEKEDNPGRRLDRGLGAKYEGVPTTSRGDEEDGGPGAADGWAESSSGGRVGDEGGGEGETGKGLKEE